MERPGWRRRSIAALSAGSLVFGTTASLAQEPPVPGDTAQACRMQRSANPACRPPQDSEPVAVTESTDTSDGAEQPPVEDDDGLSFGEVLLLIGAAVVAALLVKELTGSKDSSIGDLERDGPKTPRQELLGQYEVQGLALPGWPIVIEVDADPDATTFLQVIASDGKKDAIPPMVLSDAGGAPWGDRPVLEPIEVQRTERGLLAKFVLPAELAGGDSEGFHSARFAVASGRMEDGKFVYRPIDVLALGAGPTAVGSAAVEITRFDPVPRTRRADYEVTFNAPRTFSSLRAELVERRQSGRETTRRRIASQDICRRPDGLDLCQDIPPRVPFPVDGSWPIDATGQLGTGKTYHMELRAFTGRIQTGGWLVGQAPQVVTWP